MRFGLFIPQGWRMDLVGIDPQQQWSTMRSLAEHADTGDAWESIWVYDHFHTVPVRSEEACHEAWSLMAAFAASTSRVRLGQMCTCMAYRNPMYLAKVASTVDHVSGGRVEMGIGAGWYEHEFRAYGYGFPRAGVRLAMLDEGVRIMRQAWETGRVDFHGEHYEIADAYAFPTPVQPGGIPLWVAGGGERKTLRTAARYARYTNFDGTPEVFEHKSRVLAEHCKEVGRDFGEITRTADYNVVIGRDEAEVADRLAWIGDHYRKVAPHKADAQVESFRTGPLVGTPEQVVEKLEHLRGLGMEYAITYFVDAAYDRSSLELFEREVVPALRG